MKQHMKTTTKIIYPVFALFAFACFAPSTRAQCTAPPSGLVSWWPGDGNANDIVGGNHGTLQGNVTFVPGMVGQAFSFDGNSYVDAPDFNLPVGNSSATISAWIKTTQTPDEYFVGWGTVGCPLHAEITAGIDSNHLVLESCGGAAETSSIVNDGAWHHVVAVWYGSDQSDLYVDGISTSVDHGPGQPLPSINIISNGHFNIGKIVQFVPEQAFIGLVDEVQIFNRPLSASEIQAIFNAGTAGLCRYSAEVQSPIDTDGTSIFNVRRGVIPVKFALTQDGVATCQLPFATIALARTAGGPIGAIDESVYTGAADTGSNFRVTNCQYVYNLSASALGVGTYRVEIKINNQVVGSAVFGLK